MFILDSLLIGGIRWAIDKAITAAEAEMNDDSTLREALLEAEMRREMGEISDDDFAQLEADLLARIREIKERRDGGAGPLAFGGAQPMETSPDSTFQVEATVSGDFYDPSDAPHTTVVEDEPGDGLILRADEGDQVRMLDMTPGEADPGEPPALPLTRPRRRRRARVAHTTRASRTAGTSRTARTVRTRK